MIERFLLNLYERITDMEIPAKDFKDMIKDGEINKNEYFISVSLLKNHINNIKFLLEEEQKEKQRQQKSKTPWKTLMFVEDGSCDVDALIDEMAIKNPEIKVVVYRNGANKPELLPLGDRVC